MLAPTIFLRTENDGIPVRPHLSASLALADTQICSFFTSSAIQCSGEAMIPVSHFVSPGGSDDVAVGGWSHEGGDKVKWMRVLRSVVSDGFVYSGGNSKTIFTD